MNELYWIGRCAVLNEIAGIVVCVALIIAGLLTVAFFVGCLEDESDSASNILSCIKKLAVITMVSAIIYAFIPSKEEMYLILGVGGTIDYIQSNDKAKQLPDKCIDAIDAWVESLNGEEE